MDQIRKLEDVLKDLSKVLPTPVFCGVRLQPRGIYRLQTGS